MPTTLLINIFYLDLKFEKSTIELHFFFLYPSCLQNIQTIKDK